MLFFILYPSSKAFSTERPNYLMTKINIFWRKEVNLLNQEILFHHIGTGILICGDRSSLLFEYLVNIQWQ